MITGTARLDLADAKVVERFGQDASVLWRRTQHPGIYDDVREETSYALVHGGGSNAALSFVTVWGLQSDPQVEVSRTIPLADLSAGLTDELDGERLRREAKLSLAVLFRAVCSMTWAEGSEASSLAWEEIGDGLVDAVVEAVGESSQYWLDRGVAGRVYEVVPLVTGIAPDEVEETHLLSISRAYVHGLAHAAREDGIILDHSHVRLMAAVVDGLRRYVEIAAAQEARTGAGRDSGPQVPRA